VLEFRLVRCLRAVANEVSGFGCARSVSFVHSWDCERSERRRALAEILAQFRFECVVQ